MLLHSLRAEQTWGQLLEDVRAHICRGKKPVLPILSSIAPLTLTLTQPLTIPITLTLTLALALALPYP